MWGHMAEWSKQNTQIENKCGGYGESVPVRVRKKNTEITREPSTRGELNSWLSICAKCKRGLKQKLANF